jgi:hypothetical protein
VADRAGDEQGRGLTARLTLSGDESFAFGLGRFLGGVAALVARPAAQPG